MLPTRHKTVLQITLTQGRP